MSTEQSMMLNTSQIATDDDLFRILFGMIRKIYLLLAESMDDLKENGNLESYYMKSPVTDEMEIAKIMGMDPTVCVEGESTADKKQDKRKNK